MREILASLQPRIMRAEALLNSLSTPTRAGKRRRVSPDCAENVRHALPPPRFIQQPLTQPIMQTLPEPQGRDTEREKPAELQVSIAS